MCVQMPMVRVGHGKSVTLRVECFLLLVLWALEFVMLCTCFSEVLQVNIFLLLCLKLTESNFCTFRGLTHKAIEFKQQNFFKSTPKVPLLHLNLACQSEIEKH